VPFHCVSTTGGEGATGAAGTTGAAVFDFKEATPEAVDFAPECSPARGLVPDKRFVALPTTLAFDVEGLAALFGPLV
jgi:hypothetical protein